MSALEILQTKLTPPPLRADRIRRPRLAQRFSAGMAHRLTLVCAPAGYGKSTLLAEWFGSDEGMPIPFGWLSLDEDDNDPVRFLTYLISTFVNTNGVDAGEVLALLHSPQPPPPKSILAALIRRLETSPRPLAVVLDDYHVVTAQPIHEAMVYLLEHLPSEIFVVVTSREDPPFPLARFRGRGQLEEIRADDLRFTPEEAAEYLRQMLSIELSAKQVSDLDVRTEGWVAGLKLAALAMRGRQDIDGFISAFTGSHRYILDYLTDEVLQRQPDITRSFLLQTSILNRLSGALCDAVTARADGQAQLEQMERSNLFLIPLDDERRWFRYHHLFGDMLRRILQHTDPGSVLELHRRASAWFEQNGSISEAIDHALIAQNYTRAAGLSEQRFEQASFADGILTFMRWMRNIPDDIWQAFPRLQLNYAFTLITMDAFGEAERHLLEAEHQLAQQDFVAEDEHRKLAGFAATLRMTLDFHLEREADTIIASGLHALALLSETETRWRAWSMIVIACSYYAGKGQMLEAASWFQKSVQLNDQDIKVGSLEPALHHLTRMYFVQGQLHKAQATAQRLVQSSGQIVYQGVAHLELSKLYYERNDMDKTLHHALKGWDTVREYALIRLTLEGYVILARIRHTQGDEAEARALMQQVLQIIRNGALKQIFLPAAAWQAWLWLMQGNLEAAAQWAWEIEPTVHGDLNPALEFEHMILARVQIAQGRLDSAQSLLARLRTAAHDAGRLGRVISLSILQALAARLQGNIDAALDALGYALSLAEPEGYVRTFIDEGTAMEELLRIAQIRGMATVYVTQLLAAFDPDASRFSRVQPTRKSVGDFEALSDREMEVLRLMADGATNQEIAQTLVISIGTVKKHSSNIFLKLNAHNRTQAVSAARSRNLI